MGMEHRGVECRIMQGIKPGDWKWSVETETGTKCGRLTAGMRRWSRLSERSTTHSTPKNGSSVRQHEARDR
jgi:hypothetical protein